MHACVGTYGLSSLKAVESVHTLCLLKLLFAEDVLQHLSPPLRGPQPKADTRIWAFLARPHQQGSVPLLLLLLLLLLWYTVSRHTFV